MQQQEKKKSLSIRIKLVGIVIPIVLVIIISFFALARNVVLKNSQEAVLAKSQKYAEEISAWTSRIFGELQVYQNTIEEDNFANDAAVLKYLETTVGKNDAYPVGIYLGDDSGVYLDGSGWVPDADWVLTERDWYVDGKNNEELAFGEPYYDSMTGQVCVSASVHMDYKKATRVLASDVYLDYVSGIVSDVSRQSIMDAFLVTKNSRTIIAHIDAEMMAVTLGAEGVDSLYTNIGNALAADKSGIVSVNGDGGKYVVCLNPVENTDWYLVTYVKEQQVLFDLYQMQAIMVLIAVVATIGLILAILRVMNGVVRPVRKMTDAIDRIAEGDFSHNLETKGNDEVARMGRNMQMFITGMRSTISEISNTAKWLESQSLENSEVSDSLKTASGKQAQEMEVLEEMVERLSGAAEEASAQMDSLASLIQETHEEGVVADRLMQESVVMSQNGKKDMEYIDKGMSNINESITMLSEQIDKVGDIVLQIGNMVDMIIDIADETNLLSLNASIEAARAGEAGRGFAVVAEQIGKLATNSSVAADTISKLTGEIRSTVDAAVEQMKASVTEVQANVSLVTEAGATFEDLYGKVDETNSRVEQMLELVIKVDEVAKQMDVISRSQAEAAEQIVQSTDALNSQTRTVKEGSNAVAEGAEGLKKESNALMSRISKFKV